VAVLSASAGEQLVLVANVNGVRPNFIAFDQAGNLYFTDWAGHRVWKRYATGTVTCIAGTGQRGFGGDGGPALKATLNHPESILATDNGDLWIADTHNNRVRKIDAKTGIMTTIIGTGESAFSGDGGPAARATFRRITCLAFDAKREKLYLVDFWNRRVRKVDLDRGWQRRRGRPKGRRRGDEGATGVAAHCLPGPRRQPLHRRHRRPGAPGRG
jgi:sugar lactone lactonase YvrE